MKAANSYRIDDLIEQISEVQKMIDMHQSAGDSFMVEQYVYRRDGFVKQLIVELLKVKTHSPKVIRAIRSCIKILEKDASEFDKSASDDLPFDMKSLEAIA
jgi:TRAP-type mannitol/chloroaromatic compound transport system substrate-binding protein